MSCGCAAEFPLSFSGADEIVTNSLSRSLPPDTATEDVIESFVKGGDLSVDDTAVTEPIFHSACALPIG